MKQVSIAQFLEKLRRDQILFFEQLSDILGKGGFPLKSAEVEKVYNIACRLFHHLWWARSKNRRKKYERSTEGRSFEEFMAAHKQLWKFPTCLNGLYSILHLRMVELITEGGNEANFKAMLEKVSSLIKIFTEQIELIKSSSNHFGGCKTSRKRELKQGSIQGLLIPFMWKALIRQYERDPDGFADLRF